MVRSDASADPARTASQMQLIRAEFLRRLEHGELPSRAQIERPQAAPNRPRTERRGPDAER